MIRGFFRMVRSILDRRYRPIPWKPIAFAAVLLIYLFSPVDLIPDYIPFLGVIDDVVLLGFFLRSLQKEVRRFRAWEEVLGRGLESIQTAQSVQLFGVRSSPSKLQQYTDRDLQFVLL